ncbi:MAG: DUF389 domain-containing protein [Chloroflexota bacterium]|jgi:hypothetical protein
MPRRVEITISPVETEALVERIMGIDGLIGLRVQAGASRKPYGDVISLEITNRALPELARLLEGSGVGNSATGSFSTSEPISITSSTLDAAIVRDVSDATWEEMELVIAKNSNVNPDTALLMAITGVIATIGIATNALHIVVGAMLIAPGFQPIVRVALGIVGRSEAWRRGLADIARGYIALAAGAAATAHFLRALGESAIGMTEASYLPEGVLVSYWTTITVPSLVVTTVAGMAGALLIATNRAVLTAGVMVAIALVPGATIAVAAAIDGEFALAASGATRWLIEIVLVLLASLLVLQWKQSRVHRRPAML